MTAKKLAIGAGLAGAGVFAARSLGPKLHEHCLSMCVGCKCGGAHKGEEPHESTELSCGPQAARDDALVA
jgi:hypothetical protein